MKETVYYVGRSGTCHYQTLEAALAAAPKDDSPLLLLVQAGDYRENVKLYRDNVTIRALGEVKIIGELSAHQLDEEGKPLGTFRTATLLVNARNIRLCNLTIINEAGPGEVVEQAVAAFLWGQSIQLEHCRFLGYQDTLCLGPLPPTDKYGNPMTAAYIRRTFAESSYTLDYCYVEGTLDFIFGGGQAEFFRCQIHSLTQPDQLPGYITAAATPEQQNSGFCFKDCLLTAESETANVFLGRPWRSYAAVSFEDCRIDSHIDPKGWGDWDNPANHQTVKFREANNQYLGSSLQRPEWVDFSKE